MNENENNFDALHQLLQLKRHEMPPPGYFNNFSAKVISRIRAGETQAVPIHAQSWLLKFLQLFELKPAFAGAFASALCLLLVFGIVYADRPDSGLQPFFQDASSSMTSFAAATPGVLPSSAYAVDLTASNNPAASLQPVESFFGSQNPLVQPASFSPSNQ
jgi:hypothetical protein